MKKITCFCGNSFDIEFNEYINLLENPEISDQIINNNFMVFTCPVCNKKLTPEFTTIIHDNKLDITMIPEIDRDRLLANKLIITTLQVVVGFPELQEKFLIRKYDFDDRIIEIIKLFLLEKIDSNIETNILFHNFVNKELIFHIKGLKMDEIGISKIPINIYNNIQDNLETRLQDPDIKELLKFPYRSVNTISTEVN